MSGEAVRCAVCVNFTLKGQSRASLDMYTCKRFPPSTFFSARRIRDCPIYKEVPADQLAARLKWEQQHE